MLKRLLLILITFNLFILNTSAVDPFTVRVVYFKPTDAPEMEDEIQDMMHNIHEYYGSEMERYGHGLKTFRIQNDPNNNIIVHTINAKQNSAYYATAENTYSAIKPELQAEYTNLKYIHVIFVGGINRIKTFNTTILGIGVLHAGNNNNGGYALLPTELPTNNILFRVAIHEIGHTFGLQHNTEDNPNYVMGPAVVWGNHGFEYYETRWLDRSYYFNPHPPPINTFLPQTTKVYPLKRHNNTIWFNADLESINGLYQAQLARYSDAAVIDTEYFTGERKETALFEFSIDELKANVRLEIRIMDINGLILWSPIDIEIPPETTNNTKREKKNTDIAIDPQEDPTPPPVVNNPPQDDTRSISPHYRLTTLWASVKSSR